jgi:hypothetical protein
MTIIVSIRLPVKPVALQRVARAAEGAAEGLRRTAKGAKDAKESIIRTNP